MAIPFSLPSGKVVYLDISNITDEYIEYLISIDAGIFIENPFDSFEREETFEEPDGEVEPLPEEEIKKIIKDSDK